jgi:hypothetical protein
VNAPRLNPRVIGRVWTVTILPDDPIVGGTGWTAARAELRYGPSTAFDLIATSDTETGPLALLSHTIAVGGDLDAGEFLLTIDDAATALISPAKCAGEERDLWLEVWVTAPETGPDFRVVIPAIEAVVA